LLHCANRCPFVFCVVSGDGGNGSGDLVDGRHIHDMAIDIQSRNILSHFANATLFH